jgi:hypothetical protein
VRYNGDVQPSVDVYLETGAKRVFAAAIDWPGWCRAGRGEDAALATLAEYRSRYSDALSERARGLPDLAGPSGFRVTERLRGNATTDYGAPGVALPSDGRPIDDNELSRLTHLLEAAWAAFDRTADAARGVDLRTGPRGGGRDRESIVEHVFSADSAYLAKLGGRFRSPGPFGEAERRDLREAFVVALAARANGEPLAASSRLRSVWSPRFAIRRSAWHALDHAWEIEDRRIND